MATLGFVQKWFCVLMVLSACCAVSVPRNDDAMVTCETTSSALGETGQVTCHFPADVSSLLPAAITIEKYSNIHDTEQKFEPVLDCKWYEGGDIQCATKEGYELHGPVERQLYLNITVMAQAHAGRYKCKMMTPRLVTNDEHVCDLKLLPAKKPVPTEEATTTAAAAFSVGEQSDAQSVPEPDVSAADSSITVIIGAVVGGVVFVAIIVILLIVFLGRRRRRNNAACESGSAKTTDAKDPNSPDAPERDYEPKDESRKPLLSKTNENDVGLVGPRKPPRTMETTNSTTEQNDVENDSNLNNDVGALDDKAALADVKAQNDDALNGKTGLANAPKAALADAKTPNDDKALTDKAALADAKPQNDGNASKSGKAALAEAKDQNGDALNGKTAIAKDSKPALSDAKTKNDDKNRNGKAAPAAPTTQNDDTALTSKPALGDATTQHDKDAPNGKTALAEAPKTGLDDAKAQAALADAKTPNDEDITAHTDDNALADNKNPHDVDAGDDDDFASASLRRKRGSQRKVSTGNWRDELIEAATDIDGRAQDLIKRDKYRFMSDDMRKAAREKPLHSTYGTATEEKSPTARQGFDPSSNTNNFTYLN